MVDLLSESSVCFNLVTRWLKCMYRTNTSSCATLPCALVSVPTPLMPPLQKATHPQGSTLDGSATMDE